MENINTKFATGRLESLKQGTILEKCAEINLDSAYDVYDSMIKLFANGNFDPVFNSPAFVDLNTDERRELLKKGRQYLGLCFSGGKIDNWAEYAANKCGDDFDLCFINAFRNFDTLLTILRYGKEDSMNLIAGLREENSDFDGSIIDELRMYFPDDATLIQAMIEMGQSTNHFAQYSNNYKRLLCQFADGILYNKEKDTYSLRSPLSIALDVRKKITGESNPDTFSFDKYGEMIKDSEAFTEAIMSLSYDRTFKTDESLKVGYSM